MLPESVADVNLVSEESELGGLEAAGGRKKGNVMRKWGVNKKKEKVEESKIPSKEEY